MDAHKAARTLSSEHNWWRCGRVIANQRFLAGRLDVKLSGDEKHGSVEHISEDRTAQFSMCTPLGYLEN